MIVTIVEFVLFVMLLIVFVDVIGRLGVYTLDGNEQHKSLLQFVCKEEDLERTTLMICLDYSKPW